MFDHGQPTYAEVNRDVLGSMLETGPRYWILLGTTMTIAGVFFFMPWIYQLMVGVGAAGMNRNALWGTYLSNFIFWIGLSHSGTLLSAVLHITNSQWRKSIYRSAEAMTLFSLMTAALFVLVHVGRVWFVHWSFPIPNPMGLWPNFRSPLMFDVMAITTYLTASSIFIYMGSLPDFAAVRDATTGVRRRLYTILSFGWRGTAREWHTLGAAYMFFAVFVIPLAVSVHSIVSWDFALSVVPGLHHTIFAPYFVCGAIYSGTAGIVTVMYLLRKFLNFERYIGETHLDNLGKLLLVLSMLWTYINILELFTTWYSGTSFEMEALKFRMFGFYAPLYWEMILFCAFVPLLMLFRKMRLSWNKMLVISILINIGMLTERFIIVATSQPRKFLPDAFGFYFPSWIEISITFGSFAIFTTLFLIFIKVVPAVSIYEVKETLKPLKRNT
ncbi:MAG: NrfD/PsrC family molybdoenzyme membrane anchor subunit [Pseudomonadota bacterium]|nr:NrfD/PsrC family molybdoenzyme membrane anchor subunit [Pseudomonadota bacterium]